MIQLDILEIVWKNEPNTGTKKEFNEGKTEFCVYPIIKTKIPNGFNPIQPKDLGEFYLENYKKGRLICLNISGYHICDDYLLLSPFEFQSKDKDGLKVYFVN